MTTLIIGTPWYKRDKKTGLNIGKPGQSHSWETYFNTGIGLGYILYPGEYNELQQSIKAGTSKLVMLRNGRNKRRAEARLTELKMTPRQAKNGQWRCDVYFIEQKEATYAYLPHEKLKRNGVKVI